MFYDKSRTICIY